MSMIVLWAVIMFFVLMMLFTLFLLGWAIGFNDALSNMKQRYQQAVNTARGVPPELKDLTPLEWAKMRPAEVARKQGYDAQGRKIIKKTWSIY